jgi:NADPH:quinone reductase-like Zn-dependent oxidoreductase
LAVQLAKARGAYVLGIASAAKHEFLQGIGVDEPIDYQAVDFADAVRDVDVVLDTFGGDYVERSLQTLRPNGILVTIVDYRRVGEVGDPRAVGLLVEPDHAGLEQIAELVEKGQLRAHIAATFPLEQAADAHRLGEAGRTTGKIVLTVA